MNILDELKKRILTLDGSMGALLQNRGLPHGHAPDLWNLDNPDPIRDVHRQYAEAGAEIILTNTFGASRLRLEEYGSYNRLKEINHAAVRLAREGAPNCIVAGDIGPLGGIMAPTGEISFDDGVAIFREQAAALVEAGVDLLVIETMFDLMEVKAAVIAANDVRGSVPLLACMTFNADGVTDTGTDPVTAASVLEGLGVDIIGVNCSIGPEAMVNVVERIATATALPIAVEPNAGLPVNRGGITVFETPMEKVASYAEPFARAGANIIGGCCGTTPDYVRMIRETLKEMKPKDRDFESPLLFSSRMITLQTGDGWPFVKIGEKINPSGRKAFAQSIKEDRLDMIISDARKQYESGALALDVNVGVPLVDEADRMEKAVVALQNVIPLPLVLDSSYATALEAGLKVYPGRALINSINGEDERLEEVAPIVKRYGASVIALLTADDIPERSVDRIKIAEKILRYLEDHGVSKKPGYFRLPCSGGLGDARRGKADPRYHQGDQAPVWMRHDSGCLQCLVRVAGAKGDQLIVRIHDDGRRAGRSYHESLRQEHEPVYRRRFPVLRKRPTVPCLYRHAREARTWRGRGEDRTEDHAGKDIGVDHRGRQGGDREPDPTGAG